MFLYASLDLSPAFRGCKAHRTTSHVSRPSNPGPILNLWAVLRCRGKRRGPVDMTSHGCKMSFLLVNYSHLGVFKHVLGIFTPEISGDDSI